MTMWVARYPVAALDWVLIDKPCARGGCEFAGGLGRVSSSRAGSFVKMAANAVASCWSNGTVERASRLGCIFLGPGATSSRNLPLNLRCRVRQSGHRNGRQFNASLDDGAVVSGDGKEGEEEKEVPANSLEFTHKVALDVLAPPDLVWKLWTDIKSAPQWMRWIDRVDFLDEDDGMAEDLPPGLSRLSRWICSTIGFEVMWVARVDHVESNLPVRVLRWVAVEGLPSRGEVTFKEKNSIGTTVELSISHSLPAALGRVMQSSALRGLVQATLQTDLECFQKYAAEAVNQQHECVTTEEDGVTERKGSLTITTDCSQNLRDTL